MQRLIDLFGCERVGASELSVEGGDAASAAEDESTEQMKVSEISPRAGDTFPTSGRTLVLPDPA